jgi:hypothetical protein
MKWADMRNVWGRRQMEQGVGEEPQGRRPLERPRLEDNIKVDLKGIGW